MAKPEWGVKRTCQECGAKFYDMQHKPATCPKCETVFVEEVVKTRRKRTPKVVAPKAKVAVVAAAESDDEADAVASADDLDVDLDDDDDDDELVALANDDDDDDDDVEALEGIKVEKDDKEDT